MNLLPLILAVAPSSTSVERVVSRNTWHDLVRDLGWTAQPIAFWTVALLVGGVVCMIKRPPVRVRFAYTLASLLPGAVGFTGSASGAIMFPMN